jgi:hypothetical protein
MVADDVELFLFGSAKVPWERHWRERSGTEQFLIAMGQAAEVKDLPDVVIGAGIRSSRFIGQRCASARLAATRTSFVFTSARFARDSSFACENMLTRQRGKLPWISYFVNGY